MFLKRLELQGFKSFAHKTTVEFMQGVTIVVGPNGCGKSNVLDAMKWVLGATSAKSLRGQRMGDVLFRGSASMKGANFAQINLVLGNDDHRLRLDQSEVMVTRRLFSNGDSEYLINRQKARMRDIHELFLDTGLGADGYSIIEQGRISEMVAMKPIERRTVFEEAAGISRYKARREETMRKLVRTEEDLLRLFDIVSEVERSCNSLYRQAKKAERHRKLSRRLTRLQKRLLVVRHGILADKLEGVNEKLTAAKEAFEAAAAKLAKAEADRAEASRLMEDYQRKLQELQQQRYDLQNAINREQSRINTSKERITAIKERIALLEREMSSSTNRLTVLRQTITALEADLEREQKQLADQSGVTEDKIRQLEALRREHDETNAKLARMRAELQAERNRESKVQNDRRLAEQLIERLRGELATHTESMEKLRQESEEASAEAKSAKQRMDQHQARLKEIQQEMSSIRGEISEGDKERSELAQRLDSLTHQVNKASSRLQALEELEESYEGYYRGVKEVMQEAQRGRLTGIIGVLSNALKVSSEYETAIEVALGGSLQDIITHSEKDARAAIDFLKQRKVGRATFLPIDLLETYIKTDHLERIMNRPGVIGLARDLVEFDPIIQKAVDRRLSNTLIVQELPIAVQLQREGIRNRYVSLDGQLVDPSGVMTGGSHQSRGLLTRTREIRQLRDQAAALEADRKRVQEQLGAMKDRLSQMHARSAELQAEMHQEQMAEARAEKDWQSSEARSRERRNALAASEARGIQQRHDLQKHEETIEECDKALEQLRTSIEQKERELQDADTASGDRGRRLGDLMEEVSAGRASLSGLRERVSALSTKLQEVRAQSENADTEQVTRSAERDQLDSDLDEAQEVITQAEGVLGGLIKQRDELEAKLSSLTQDNEAKIKEAREGLAEVQSFQRDRNVKENSLREIESQATELKAQMNYLRQEAEDEFQQSIKAIAAELELKEEETSELLPSPKEEEGDADEAAEEEEFARDFEKDDQITEPNELRALVNELRGKIQRMGAVNETAIDEYKEQKQRLDFLTAQRDDLIEAKEALTETITSLDETTTRLFNEAFEQIQRNFQENFRRLFNGGKGDLVLVMDEEKDTEPGIEIWAQPPGKNIGGSITLLSGGEKAMTAIALMISLFQFRPSPVCILDEIDAPLDDVNCQRLCDALKEYAKQTQFIIITHNKITMSLADTIYGVTMQEPGISKLVSVKFDKIEESGLLESAG